MTGFETLAASYDRTFDGTDIGARMRARTRARLDTAFRPGQRVLELNCGTGEDALHLARRGIRVIATDASPAMLGEARRKIAAEGLSEWVETRLLPIETIGDIAASAPFDGAFSNFGGLNCVADLNRVAAGLAGLVRPGGAVFLAIMGPIAPLEWLWFAAHGQPGRAFRRLRRGGTPWRGLTVRYPSVLRTGRAFGHWFTTRQVRGLGVALPGTYAEGWAARHPRALAALDRLDRTIEALPPAWLLADHYLMELSRREGPGS